MKAEMKKLFNGIIASLTGALIYIGALTVISTLWNGDERSLIVAALPAAIVALLLVNRE